MNPADLGTLISQHKWIAATAVVVGLLTRLAKADTILPTVPARARVWLVLGLGIASGVLERVASGTTWTAALVDGLVGSLLAMLGHETVIASLRSGREFSVPGLTIPGASPSPGAPVTRPLPTIHTRDTDPPPAVHNATPPPRKDGDA